MYFIHDANNNIFGNPKGYKTYKSAMIQCTKQRFKLWAIYDNRENKESNKIWDITWDNKVIEEHIPSRFWI